MNPQVSPSMTDETADLMTCSVIFDQLVGLEYVRPNLAAPRDVLLFADDGVELGFLFLLFQFEEAAPSQDFHRSVSILELGPLILALHDEYQSARCVMRMAVSTLLHF